MEMNEKGEVIVSEQDKEILDKVIIPMLKEKIAEELAVSEEQSGWDRKREEHKPHISHEHDHKVWLGSHEKRDHYRRPMDFLAKDYKMGWMPNPKWAMLEALSWESVEDYSSLGYEDVAEQAHAQLMAENSFFSAVKRGGLRAQVGAMPSQENLEKEGQQIMEEDSEKEKGESFFDRFLKKRED
jgi:hypothetical protein